MRPLVAPLVGFALILAMAIPFSVLMTSRDIEMSLGSAHLYNAAVGFVIAWGVELDRRQKNVSAPFEYSAFMFFLWWILLPVYLFRTRRWKGLGIALVVLLASMLPTFVAYAVYAFAGEGAVSSAPL